jgi:hypothetical protein
MLVVMPETCLRRHQFPLQGARAEVGGNVPGPTLWTRFLATQRPRAPRAPNPRDGDPIGAVGQKRRAPHTVVVGSPRIRSCPLASSKAGRVPSDRDPAGSASGGLGSAGQNGKSQSREIVEAAAEAVASDLDEQDNEHGLGGRYLCLQGFLSGTRLVLPVFREPSKGQSSVACRSFRGKEFDRRIGNGQEGIGGSV